jgi:hypothetical protein
MHPGAGSEKAGVLEIVVAVFERILIVEIVVAFMMLQQRCLAPFRDSFEYEARGRDG